MTILTNRPPNIINTYCTLIVGHPYSQRHFTIHYNILFGLWLIFCGIGLFGKRRLDIWMITNCYGLGETVALANLGLCKFNAWANLGLYPGELGRLASEVASDNRVVGLATLCSLWHTKIADTLFSRSIRQPMIHSDQT